MKAIVELTRTQAAALDSKDRLQWGPQVASISRAVMSEFRLRRADAVQIVHPRTSAVIETIFRGDYDDGLIGGILTLCV